MKNATRRHSKPSPRASPSAGGANRVRIVAGRYGGRWIEFADRHGLRPTPNRVRETVFNWLGQRLDGLNCLDLFAGSGALGFEAASRGAASVTLVERDAQTVAALKANRERLGANECRIVRADALVFLRANTARFDIVFLDPPFGTALLGETLDVMSAHLANGARVYVEWGEAIDPTVAALPDWHIEKSGRAGVVHFALLATPTPPGSADTDS